MPECRDILLEVGCEELPPTALRAMSEALCEGMGSGLARLGLEVGSVRGFATPRRLAVLVTAVPDRQPDRDLVRRGPAVRIAFDDEGSPTKAALGFARSCGVAVTELERTEPDKPDGSGHLMFRSTEAGEATAALLPGLANAALDALPIPKRMRWGDSSVEFSRPVHWLVFLFGADVVQAELLGLSAGRATFGHRFHHPDPIAIDEPGRYADLLRDTGWVEADFAVRRERIRTGVEATAAALGATASIDPALLEEVTALVEWPVPILGSFEEQFLELPDELLVASMQGHQKYFPVRGDNGDLLPHFITVSNIASSNPESVRAGNERVIRPRLSDAAFFFKTDLGTPLAARQAALGDVVFQQKLGTILDKAHRISQLAGHAAIAMGEAPDVVKLTHRAGEICKFDLMTELVGEFPELQGVIGGEYARRQGEPEVVAEAIAELYRPRFAGDAIPSAPIGRAIAIADKLDTLVGIFGIGQAPTGDRDPYALRRAALGVLRIIIEAELTLDLPRLIDAAVAAYGDKVAADGLATTVTEFMTERLRRYFADQGIPATVFNAVQARRPARPYDFARRVQAVNAFRQLPEADGLAAANKRINNILTQAGLVRAGNSAGTVMPAREFDDSLFTADAEWNLAAKLVGLGPRVREMLNGGDYTGAMTALAGLREAVDEFFDTVKVMDDDERVRDNRLTLLGMISDLFLHTADISLLQE